MSQETTETSILRMHSQITENLVVYDSVLMQAVAIITICLLILAALSFLAVSPRIKTHKILELKAHCLETQPEKKKITN